MSAYLILAARLLDQAAREAASSGSGIWVKENVTLGTVARRSTQLEAHRRLPKAG